MIEQYFAAPLTITHYGKPWPQYTRGPTDLSGEALRASKRGLSTEEYRARVALVAKEQSSVSFQTGDTVWPIYPKDIKRLGQCMITGFCRHYDDYGDMEWNDPPFLLSIQSLSDRNKSIQCSVGWVTKTRPENAEVVVHEC